MISMSAHATCHKLWLLLVVVPENRLVFSVFVSSEGMSVDLVSAIPANVEELFEGARKEAVVIDTAGVKGFVGEACG